MNTFAKTLLICALAAAELSQAISITQRGGTDRRDRRDRGDQDAQDADANDAQEGDAGEAQEREFQLASLSGLCTNPDTVTMSGFSVGGTFAHIMQMAHSEKVKGVGIMNGAAYGSNKEQLTDDAVTADDLLTQALALADTNVANIDPLVANMGNNFVYIVGGDADEVVPLKNQEAVFDTYDNYGATSFFDEITDGAHKKVEGKPEEIIQWLYTGMRVTNEFNEAVDAKENGTCEKFDQLEIAESLGLDAEANSISQKGTIYVPDACREAEASCHVHFVFEGSRRRKRRGGRRGQDDGEEIEVEEEELEPVVEAEGDAAVEGRARKANLLNNFAAANNIIMVYPASGAGWDAYGELDADNYANQLGTYPQFVMEMLAILESCPEPDLDEGENDEETIDIDLN